MTDNDELKERIEAFGKETEKFGLYLNGGQTWFDNHDPTLPPNKMLTLVFTIGDRAFSKEVQDPESHAIDEQFHNIESGMLKDQVEDTVTSLQDLLDDE